MSETRTHADLCTDYGCALQLILPQGEPEHHFSETGEYQSGYIYRRWSSSRCSGISVPVFFRSATAAFLPKVYSEQLSLLLLWLLHTSVFVLLPVPKAAHLKYVRASAAFLMAIGESGCSCFFSCSISASVLNINCS